MKVEVGTIQVDIFLKWLSGKLISTHRYISFFFCLPISDFEIREANALKISHTYTVMCVLPVNLFNQVRERKNKTMNLDFFLILANFYISLVLVCYCHHFDNLWSVHLDISTILSMWIASSQSFTSYGSRISSKVAV